MIRSIGNRCWRSGSTLNCGRVISIALGASFLGCTDSRSGCHELLHCQSEFIGITVDQRVEVVAKSSQTYDIYAATVKFIIEIERLARLRLLPNVILENQRITSSFVVPLPSLMLCIQMSQSCMTSE